MQLTASVSGGAAEASSEEIHAGQEEAEVVYNKLQKAIEQAKAHIHSGGE